MTQKLLTRLDIAEMVTCSRSKLGKIIITEKYGFPKPEKIGEHKTEYFDEAKVIAWLNNNNTHDIHIKNQTCEKMPTFDNKLAQQFLFGRLCVKKCQRLITNWHNNFYLDDYE